MFGVLLIRAVNAEENQDADKSTWLCNMLIVRQLLVTVVFSLGQYNSFYTEITLQALGINSPLFQLNNDEANSYIELI